MLEREAVDDVLVGDVAVQRDAAVRSDVELLQPVEVVRDRGPVRRRRAGSSTQRGRRRVAGRCDASVCRTASFRV